MKKLTSLVLILGLGFFVIPGKVFALQSGAYDESAYTIIASTTPATGISGAIFGRSSPNNGEVAFKFIAPHDSYLCTVDLYLSTNGSPTDGVTASLYSGGTTAWSGSTKIADFGNLISHLDLSSSLSLVQFYFSNNNCHGFVGGTTYWLVLHRTGTNDDTNNYEFGYEHTSSGTTFNPNSSISFLWYGDLNGIYSPNSASIARAVGYDNLSGFTPTSSSTEFSCSNGSILDPICNIGAYLFIPNQNVLDNWSSITDLLSSKFPFSYVAGIENIANNITFNATSSQPSIAYNLHDLGIGSTTSLGNILPNATVLSSSTISTYLPSGILSALQTLLGSALWLLFAGNVFFTVRNLLV